MNFFKKLLPLLLVGVLFGSPAYAQATHIITSGTLPTTCTIGDIYNKTGATAGLYQCSATNTWTMLIDTTKTINNIASSTSANLASVLSDETGTGKVVFSTSPLMSTAVSVDGVFNFCADAGSTDTYVCSLAPAITAYTTGGVYMFKANTANTGAASINLNGLGAKTIVKVAGGVSTALADNDIRAGQMVVMIYDGTNMQMLSMLGNTAAGASGVTRSGSTTDLHAVIWNGSNADSVKDGGVFPNFNPPAASANAWIVWKGASQLPLAATPSSDFTTDYSTDPGTIVLSGNLSGTPLLTTSNTQTLTNKTLNSESTGNVVEHPIEYILNVAASQNAVDTLALNTSTSGAATVGHTGTTVVQPYAIFADATTNELQFNIRVPTNWDSAASVEVFGKWFTSVTSGSATWSVKGVCAADGEVVPTAYSSTADSNADTAKGTTLQLNDFSITLSTSANHSLATCSAGEHLYVSFFLTNALGAAANVAELGIRFRVTK